MVRDEATRRFLRYLHKEAAKRAQANWPREWSGSRRCLTCSGSGNINATVLVSVSGPIACTTCNGTGKEA